MQMFVAVDDAGQTDRGMLVRDEASAGRSGADACLDLALEGYEPNEA